MRTRIKVCCIASHNEARLAIEAGADAVGLVGEMPSGPGVIDDESAFRIASATPPPVASFLLSSRTTGPALADHVRYCRPTAVQIVRHVDVSEHDVLADSIPHVKRVQVVHVEDEHAIELAKTYAPHVHALLLDSGRPTASTAELGGTGRTHDWRISATIVGTLDRPVFLAGGLDPDNVEEAIRTVRPFGVDVCSGVRTDGALDPDKLDSFIDAVRRA